MTTACVCIELRLLVPNVISVSCVRARFYVVGFVLYICPIIIFTFLVSVVVFVTISVKNFCWCLSLLFVVQFMSYCDVCLRILVSNFMPYHIFLRFCFSVVIPATFSA